MGSSSYGITARPVILLVQVFGVTACVLVLYWCLHYGGGLAFSSSNKDHIFNLHPVMMFIGYIFLASQAILSFKMVPVKKKLQKIVHLSLLGLSTIIGAFGIYPVFKVHHETNIDNMFSLHSWIGMGAVCLFGVQWMVGFITFLYPGASMRIRTSVVPWHVFFGLFLYAMAIVAAETGFLDKLEIQEIETGLDKFGSEAMLVNFTAVIILLFAMLVVLSTVLPGA
ncbi:probable ascorbate-specific transmembrane electron transporter 1 [Cryptomeria japonica]|uniref:probable ascorbate-specific transmembrane electron transporter 1 n=1 Tax=Cryptomeria japonica TaxID=3369 RepID=UPI0027DA878D|nr:probable ascorbate-specific transmembrane electron transporter 1 [Cryptomeria japonica]